MRFVYDVFIYLLLILFMVSQNYRYFLKANSNKLESMKLSSRYQVLKTK